MFDELWYYVWKKEKKKRNGSKIIADTTKWNPEEEHALWIIWWADLIHRQFYPFLQGYIFKSKRS